MGGLPAVNGWQSIYFINLPLFSSIWVQYGAETGGTGERQTRETREQVRLDRRPWQGISIALLL
jgi:hypothetical protein